MKMSNLCSPDLERLGNLLRSGKPPSYVIDEEEEGNRDSEEAVDQPYSVHSPQVCYLVSHHIQLLILMPKHI